MINKQEITHCCSFCGKSNVEAKVIITSPAPRICICDECAELCVEMCQKHIKEMEEESKQKGNGDE